jgi:superfamily II DNA or RNA helicase
MKAGDSLSQDIADLEVVDSAASLALWSHQRAAVAFAENYLAAWKSDPKRRAGLVRMPTGTGKTAIMAVIANYFPAVKRVLIVAPADALTGQVCDHLNRKFWLNVHARPAHRRRAVSFVPSTLQSVLDDRTVSVVVCTTTALQMLHANVASGARKEWLAAYEQLHRHVDVVIVDEGHREPAKDWARAVRGFRLPTILFSATPYRNDFRFFNIGSGERFVSTFRFQEAVESGIVRDVFFRGPTESFRNDPTAFAHELRKFCERNAELGAALAADGKKRADLKVIVRCGDARAIRLVMKALEVETENPDSVIGIHETFSDGDRRYSHPPTKNPARYWVHQFKLTEGIDDDAFRVIAFYQPFGNARSLVQQIGRVIRNPNPPRPAKAFVFSDPTDNLEEHWKGYRGFEETEDSLISPEEVVRRFMEALPKWFYFDRRYRQPATFGAGDEVSDMDQEMREQFTVPRTAEVFPLPDGGDGSFLEAVAELAIDDYIDADIMQVARFQNSDAMYIVLLNWRMAQSEALAEDAFLDIALVPSIFYRTQSFLFHQGPTSLRDILEKKHVSAVPHAMLESLLKRPRGRITQVSLINCDLGKNSVRRRSMGARAISDIAPGLSDHFHFVSNASVNFAGQERNIVRYVGLSRGRVSDAVSERVALDDYLAWCDDIAAELALRRHPPTVLKRFAKPTPAPKKATAKHILMDFTEFNEEFTTVASLSADRLEAVAVDVVNDHFSWRVRNDTIDGTVGYDPKKKRFIIKSEAFNEKVETLDPDSRRTGTTFLNRKASVRIITEDGQLYTDGRFYDPRLPLWGRGRIKTLEILEGVDDLGAVRRGEKGRKRDKVTKKAFVMRSIFRVIDESKEFYKAAEWPQPLPELLICDDMGTEVSDFIAVDFRRKRIALIHAKEMTSLVSAADFHIVNSQAVKNLELFDPFGTALRERHKRWAKLYQAKLPRIRGKKPIDPESAFERIIALLREANVEREVWIAAGPGLSKTELLNALKGDPPEYHVIQLAYLLQSCNASVSSVGARLRILCAK